MDSIIRPAKLTDIEAMYRITSDVHLGAAYKPLIPAQYQNKFIRFYTPNDVRSRRYRQKIATRLKDQAWQVWVAEAEERVCGFTMAVETDEAIELRGLFVDEDYQRQGIGQALFEKTLIGTDKPIFLEVIEANSRAKTMYERAGFKALEEPAGTFYGAPLVRMGRH